MTRSRSRTPTTYVAGCLAILAFCTALAGYLVRDTVEHMRSGDQPATVTDVGGRSPAISNNNRRRERTIVFELADGTPHTASEPSRLLWHPDPGDTIHVYERAPGDWEVKEAFSWPRTLGGGALLLLPLLVALAKAEELVTAWLFPQRWARRQQQERERRRERRTRPQRRT